MSHLPVIIIETEEEEDTYLNKNREYIHVKILENVEFAYENNIENIELLKIINNFRGFTFILCVNKDSWVDSLEKCLSYFLKYEEYEYCNKINNLIKKIKNGNT